MVQKEPNLRNLPKETLPRAFEADSSPAAIGRRSLASPAHASYSLYLGTDLADHKANRRPAAARQRHAFFGKCLRPSFLAGLILLSPLALPSSGLAAQWGWGKADEVTARCALEPAQVERGSKTPLRAKVEATDSRGHPLAYGWSTNGGRILGSGAEVQVDASELNPGVYSVAVVAQDAYKHQASCVAHFQVVRPPDLISMSCSIEPEAVEEGKAAELKAEAADSLGHALRYRWFTNGGNIRGTGPAARLDTTGLFPGVYTVTGRAEDDWGHAADCVSTVRVELAAAPPAPPVPAEPALIAQIVFMPNSPVVQRGDQQLLEKVLNRLRDEPGGRISIESYAGPEENQPERLATERAEAVKRYLVENGAAESRMQTLVGLGGRLGGVRNRTLDIIWLPEGMDY